MASAESQQTVRLIQLTDGKQSKPLKVQIHNCTISYLLKEAKNKFRKKYKYIVYQAVITPGKNEQRIKSDADLRQVLEDHDGELSFLFSNKEPATAIDDSTTTTTTTTGGLPNDSQEQHELIVAKANRGISYIIGDENATEENAITQLIHASKLRGCIFAIGMPDLHAGKGIPIGAVIMTTENVAYPQLVDNDIGCGISFVETKLRRGKLGTNKLGKIASSLTSIDCPYKSIDEMSQLCAQSTEWAARRLDPLPVLEPLYHYQNLGTVGGGNHLAELQEFHEIFNVDTIEQRYGIDTNRVHLLVHSGSRSLGSQYLKDFCERITQDKAAAAAAAIIDKERHEDIARHGHYGVDTNSPIFHEYLHNHDVALNFAARNRQFIARRLLEQITGETEPLCKIDIYHNFMEHVMIDSIEAMEQIATQGQFPKTIPRINDEGEDTSSKKKVEGWIHRKGATPTNQSPILVIPGSRGSLSYLVEVNSAAEHGSGYSLAHGAGRKMPRSKALRLHRGQCPDVKQLLRTDFGGVVVCEKKELIYEEAPSSYKDIDGVVRCLAEDVGIDDAGSDRQGLVRILATLKPLLTYKYKDPYDQR